MEYTIRSAVIDDLKIIQELNQKLCTKERNEYDNTINSGYPLTAVGEKNYRNRIKDKDSLSLVAESNNEVIGYVVCGINDAEEHRIIKNVCELEDVWVDEKFRGKGIGREFMKQFEEWCRSKNVNKLKIVASVQNTKVIKLYKEEGYKELDLVLEKDI